ncbi:MAG TPA: hypothetical protein ENI23_15550 [bacterium]|nr:hypothetical protein [bacterium]
MVKKIRRKAKPQKIDLTKFYIGDQVEVRGRAGEVTRVFTDQCVMVRGHASGRKKIFIKDQVVRVEFTKMYTFLVGKGQIGWIRMNNV